MIGEAMRTIESSRANSSEPGGGDFLGVLERARKLLSTSVRNRFSVGQYVTDDKWRGFRTLQERISQPGVTVFITRSKRPPLIIAILMQSLLFHHRCVDATTSTKNPCPSSIEPAQLTRMAIACNRSGHKLNPPISMTRRVKLLIPAPDGILWIDLGPPIDSSRYGTLYEGNTVYDTRDDLGVHRGVGRDTPVRRCL